MTARSQICIGLYIKRKLQYIYTENIYVSIEDIKSELRETKRTLILLNSCRTISNTMGMSLGY